jgi:hypothetical protein
MGGKTDAEFPRRKAEQNSEQCQYLKEPCHKIVLIVLQATSLETKVNPSFRQIAIKFLFENNCLDHSSQDKTQQHSEHPKH